MYNFILFLIFTKLIYPRHASSANLSILSNNNYYLKIKLIVNLVREYESDYLYFLKEYTMSLLRIYCIELT